MLDDIRVQEAKLFLDQLESDLVGQGIYEKDYEGLLERMIWEIQKYDKTHQDAVKEALAYWLQGNDGARFVLALDMIDRMKLTQYVPAIEALYDAIQAGRSPWSTRWIPFLDVKLRHLRQASSPDAENYT